MIREELANEFLSKECSESLAGKDLTGKSSVFDSTTGTWTFRSLSSHKVCDNEDDEVLQKKVRERDNLNDSTLKRDSEGCLEGGKIIPNVPKTTCHCG
ncbi:hypothetical protein AC249_AIPGENE28273, partial [Exaiptasia diaphana]